MAIKNRQSRYTDNIDHKHNKIQHRQLQATWTQIYVGEPRCL